MQGVTRCPRHGIREGEGEQDANIPHPLRILRPEALQDQFNE